jgi:hypothetical protein
MLPPLLNKISALVQQRPRKERRGAKRLTPGSLTPCQIRSAEDGDPQPAWIHNLSKTGVGILSPAPFPAGSLVQIVIINAAYTFALNGAIKVVRCTRVISGNYLLGGEFTNALQHDEIVPFML